MYVGARADVSRSIADALDTQHMLVLGVVNPYIDLQIYPIISGSISAVAELILCVEMTF